MADRPAILHVIDNFEPGGAQNIIAGIVRHAAADFRHEVAVLNGDRMSYLGALAEGTPVTSFRMRGLGAWPGEARRFLALVDRLRPAVVSFNLEYAYLLALVLRPWLGKVPINLAIHAIPTQIPRFWFPLLASMRGMAAAYTVEDDIARQALIDRRVPKDRIHLIPIGTEIFEAIGETPEAVIARRWEDSGGLARAPLFLNVGRMVEGKGQTLLLDAFRAYLDQGGTGKLRIIGYGPLEESLQARSRRLGLRDKVEFAGKIQDLVAHYRAADVYVSSAVDEGMGVVIYDAMALGLPIAAFDAGSIGEIVEDGANGILAENRNPAALAAAMRELALRTEPVRRISRANVLRISENYTNSRIAERYAGLYRRLHPGSAAA